MSFLVQHEWMLIEVLVLGVALYELWSINRETWRDRKAARARAEPPE
jgi:hypothetical protein